MSGGEITINNYHTYLEQKHSQFSISSGVLKDLVGKVIDSKRFESKRIIAGEVNEVYDIKTDRDELFVRISRGRKDRFTPEKWAIDKARELGLPAPEVLLIENIKDGKNKFRASIEKKLPGIPISESKLSEEHTKEIVLEAGKILAKIHSITPQKYGELGEDGVGSCESWELYMRRPSKTQQLERLLNSANKAGIPKEQIKQVLRIIDYHSEIYHDITPHLLHGDFGPKHILLDDGKITGLLDFENAKSGDPVYDFAWWSYFGKNRPSIEWLKEGYSKVSDLPNNFNLKLRLGRLRLGMDMIFYYDYENHKMGLELAKDNLQEDLKYFDEET